MISIRDFFVSAKTCGFAACFFVITSIYVYDISFSKPLREKVKALDSAKEDTITIVNRVDERTQVILDVLSMAFPGIVENSRRTHLDTFTEDQQFDLQDNTPETSEKAGKACLR